MRPPTIAKVLLQLLFSIATVFLPGCGIGLCAGSQNAGGCIASSSLGPRLVLSGLENLSIRKNDCYAVTLSAVDAAGDTMTNINASVVVTASSGVVLYSSLSGCEMYDSIEEKSAFLITPDLPQVVFYFRSDSEGAVSLGASTSANLGLAAANQALTVEFAAFDGSTGPTGYPNAVVLDQAGRAFLGGIISTFDDFRVANIARVDVDGRLDTSFLPTGSGLNDTVNALALQNDGKLVAGGWFTSYNGTSRPRVARLNIDGSLDTLFGPTGSGLNNLVYALSIQSDGKILVGGDFATYNGAPYPYIARLNSDGSIDSTFAATGTGLDGSVRAIAVQPDGKIIVGGFFTFYNGTARRRVARLNANGSLDTSFSLAGTGFDGQVYALNLRSDGKLFVAGNFSFYNVTSRERVALLNDDGSLESSFAQSGSGLNSLAQTLSLQTDGKLIVGGWFTSYNGTSRPYSARLNVDGSLDTSFAASGTGVNGWVNMTAVQTNGKAIVVGSFNSHDGSSRPGFLRLNTDGSLDSSYATNTSGLNGEVQSIAQMAGGKSVVAGAFSRYNGTSTPGVARLNADGSLDTTFAAVGSGMNTSVYAVVVQSDNKTLAGGPFTSYNGSSRQYVARLNSDGSLDTTFTQTGSGFNGGIHSIALQSDGRALVGGWFTTYNGTGRASIARLNTDGSLDSSFAPSGSGLDNQATSIVLQPDGKAVVGGDFSFYNSTARNRILRLNSDGSLDTTFSQTGSGLNGNVNCSLLQADGKILVGGQFTSYNGTTRRRIARLNSDGTLDTQFAPTGSGLSGFSVEAISQHPNGRVVIVGEFSAFNGTTRSSIARLHSDGSLDTSFAASAGFDGIPYSVSINAASKVLVGGAFSAFGASNVSHISRLTYVGTLD